MLRNFPERLPLPSVSDFVGRSSDHGPGKTLDQNPDHPKLCVYQGKKELRPWSKFPGRETSDHSLSFGCFCVVGTTRGLSLSPGAGGIADQVDVWKVLRCNGVGTMAVFRFWCCTNYPWIRGKLFYLKLEFFGLQLSLFSYSLLRGASWTHCPIVSKEASIASENDATVSKKLPNTTISKEAPL